MSSKLPSLVGAALAFSAGGAGAAVVLDWAPEAQAQATAPYHSPYPAPGYAGWQPRERTDFDLGPTLPPWDEVNRPVHRGFHARFSAGPTLARVASIDPLQPTSFSGFAAALSLSAGSTVLDDLLVFGELEAQSAISPRIGGVDPQQFPERTAVTTIGLGGGLAYYFMPSNVNLAAAVLLSQIRTVDRQRDQLLARTTLGPALHVSAGKDWALTDSWAVGLALRAHLAQLADAAPDGAAPWRAYGLGLALSALYH